MSFQPTGIFQCAAPHPDSSFSLLQSHVSDSHSQRQDRTGQDSPQHGLEDEAHFSTQFLNQVLVCDINVTASTAPLDFWIVTAETKQV